MKLDATRTTEETTIELRLETGPNPPSVTVAWDEHGGLEEPLDPGFVEHLLEALLAYAGLEGTLAAQGDLAHHVVEDAAITIGQALHEHLAQTPVKRYATRTVPMDDALVQTALDAGGRSHYESDLDEHSLVVDHVLRSIALNAQATLHVRVIRGRDDHHIVEAAMKSLGMALEHALQPAPRVRSTKGEVETRPEGEDA